MKHLFAAIPMALLSGVAFSQGAALPDKAQANGAVPAAQQPAGPRGPGNRARMMRFNEANTPGWSLMTTEERRVHREKMHALKSVEECRAYHDTHRNLMDSRAQERGVALPALRSDPCSMMQRRGMLRQ